jgi:hypothetical protein
MAVGSDGSFRNSNRLSLERLEGTNGAFLDVACALLNSFRLAFSHRRL